MIRASLPVKLSLWICSILVVVFVTLFGYLAYRWYHEMESNLDTNGLASVQSTAYQLDKVFLQAKLSAELIAASLEKREYTEEEVPELIREMVTTFHGECSEIVGMALAFEDGMLTPGKRYNGFVGFIRDEEYQLVHWTDETNNYFERDWYRDPVEQKKSLWTKPFKAEAISGETLSSFAVPFYKMKEGTRTLAGVVVIDITLGTLERYLRGVTLPGNPSTKESSKALLIDDSGLIIAAPGRDYLHHNDLYSLCSQESPAALSQIFCQESGKRVFQETTVGSGPQEFYHACCMNGWLVANTVSANWRSRILLPMLARFVLIGIAILAIVVWVIFKVCAKLNRPLLALSHAARAVGEGRFDVALPECHSRDEISEVTDSFRRMQVALDDYVKKLEESIVARERSESELKAAKTIQKDILPHILPPFKVFDHVTGAANLTPARGVGGDLYDVFPLDKDKLVLIIGDVSGKGVPAALFMAVTQMLHRNIAMTEHSTSRLVSKLSDMLFSNNTSSMFVTYWIGILNIHTGELTYTNAGHNPPVLRHASGETEYMTERHGIPLGIMRGYEYTEATTFLLPGDMLICYTDGVTEAFNSEQEMFGEQRLLDTVARTNVETPLEMLHVVEEEVHKYCEGVVQSDDITVLVTHFHKPENPVNKRTFSAVKESLPDARAFVSAHPYYVSLDKKSQNRLQLSLEETFAKIIAHSNENDGKPRELELEIICEDEIFCVRLSDSGTPYNPLEKESDVAPKLSELETEDLGTFVMKKISDYLNYQYSDGKNITTIGEFCKAAEPEEEK